MDFCSQSVVKVSRKRFFDDYVYTVKADGLPVLTYPNTDIRVKELFSDLLYIVDAGVSLEFSGTNMWELFERVSIHHNVNPMAKAMVNELMEGVENGQV